MARRRLTEEEKSEIANKDWKQTPIFSSDERLIKRAKNLTGPKTPEGKAKALQNLRVGRNKGEIPYMSHGGYIMRLLDQEEQEMYEQFKKEFLEDYDINESADSTILELILIDKVRLYRVMRAQFDNPSMDIDRPLNEITNRLNKNLDALGALRKQRLKQDEKLTAISIGTIAQQFHKQLLDGVLQQERDEAEEEERRFLEKKKQRERESLTTIDAEYEVVDDGDREEE
jgi:hypothetical protein